VVKCYLIVRAHQELTVADSGSFSNYSKHYSIYHVIYSIQFLSGTSTVFRATEYTYRVSVSIDHKVLRTYDHRQCAKCVFLSHTSVRNLHSISGWLIVKDFHN
jgi:hypothetical protein